MNVDTSQRRHPVFMIRAEDLAPGDILAPFGPDQHSRVVADRYLTDDIDGDPNHVVVDVRDGAGRWFARSLGEFVAVLARGSAHGYATPGATLYGRLA